MKSYPEFVKFVFTFMYFVFFSTITYPVLPTYFPLFPDILTEFSASLSIGHAK